MMDYALVRNMSWKIESIVAFIRLLSNISFHKNKVYQNIKLKFKNNFKNNVRLKLYRNLKLLIDTIF